MPTNTTDMLEAIYAATDFAEAHGQQSRCGYAAVRTIEDGTDTDFYIDFATIDTMPDRAKQKAEELNRSPFYCDRTKFRICKVAVVEIADR